MFLNEGEIIQRGRDVAKRALTAEAYARIEAEGFVSLDAQNLRIAREYQHLRYCTHCYVQRGRIVAVCGAFGDLEPPLPPMGCKSGKLSEVISSCP